MYFIINTSMILAVAKFFKMVLLLKEIVLNICFGTEIFYFCFRLTNDGVVPVCQ